MRVYRGGIAVLSAVTAAIGVALIVRGAVESKPLALVLGALFIAVGVGRLTLLRRR